MVFLEELYGLLILLHLAATFLLVGAATHNLICVSRYVRGKFGRVKSELRFVGITLWSYVIVYAFGAIAYPAFRVNIRADHFDPVGWPTGLFEVKEHWAAVGLAFVVVYYLLRRTFNPAEERAKLWLYVPLCLIINVCIPGATVLSNLLLLSFFSMLIFNLIRGLDVSCGCFSTTPGERDSDYLTVLRDLSFLVVSGHLFYSTFFTLQPVQEK